MAQQKASEHAMTTTTNKTPVALEARTFREAATALRTTADAYAAIAAAIAADDAAACAAGLLLLAHVVPSVERVVAESKSEMAALVQAVRQA
jgi:hypothetical protein